MTKTVLVTGFSPFPGMPINPTAMIVDRLQQRLPSFGPSVRFAYHRLPTTWAGRHEVTAKLRRDLAPAAIVHFGVAGDRRDVNIETRAVNQAIRTIPDAASQHANDAWLERDAPAARMSTLPVRALREAGARSGVPVTLSKDAGTYLCNATLWDSIGSGIPTVFVHVPKLPRGARDQRPSLQQLEETAIHILREVARRI